MEIETIFGGAAADTVWYWVLQHTKDTSSLDYLTSVDGLDGLEFDLGIFHEGQLGILINWRLSMNSFYIKLAKIVMHLFHAI